MVRRCEFKKRYNPTSGKYEYMHIYGNGLFDPIKNIAAKILGPTTKKLVGKAAEKATTTALNKTGNYVGNKAGDKIIQLLQKGKKASHTSPTQLAKKPMTQDEINLRVQRILSGGKIRKIKI